MLQLKLSLLWLLPSQTLFDWNQTKTTLYVFTQVLEIKQKPGVKCIPLDSKHASPSELWALLHLQVGFLSDPGVPGPIFVSGCPSQTN